MVPYSFLHESFDEYDEDTDYPQVSQRKFNRKIHKPQSKLNAKSGTIGSFSSITSKYNNIYTKGN